MTQHSSKPSNDKPKPIPANSRWDPKAIEAALRKAAQHAKKMRESK